MTNTNPQISVISTFKRPKLYTHNFEKKDVAEIFLKPSCAWNTSKDMSNVSSIFNGKIKWDSLSFKTDNFAWRTDSCQSVYGFKENENKETYQQVKYKKYSPKNINNNFDLSDTLIHKNNNKITENCAKISNNTTVQLIPFSTTASSQKITNEHIETQKNNELLSFLERKYETITPKFSPQKKIDSISPIARNPFPLTIVGKSVISGLSSDITLLRTCFRVGEALKVFNLQQNSKILYFIEFFGIIKESDNKKESTTYVVGDLFHPLKGPYIYASYYDNKTTFKFQNGEMVRILGIFKKKKVTKNELKVAKMYLSTWEEIYRIKETIK
ncbi:uncharacterized protein T551_01086 [Pneumocystis jirovecii RU7]|uniref:Uncharacterized protein n=1 Tax=Pneumocystis jirovecii (strain RU7) TaxID=1408657 RepID=A0A0W4ZTX4_PNEJ7|nr:uncharacterized protein T551_01086 [Pneumocystis jirovecii RU7]KTW31825.1 hypothetical protein T551_01086 [Pneumocystis jirovecii RU7]